MTAALWRMYANTPDSADALPFLLVFVVFFFFTSFMSVLSGCSHDKDTTKFSRWQ